METPPAIDGRIAELRSSARGWHGVQLAVLWSRLRPPAGPTKQIAA